MSIKRFPKLLLVVLALALWAGTASAQTFTGTDAAGANPGLAQSLTLNYTKGTSPVQLSSTLADSGGVSTYSSLTSGYNPAGGTWLTVGGGTGTTATPTPITFSVNVVAATYLLVPGTSYTATVTVTPAGTSTTPVVYSITLVVHSPLTTAGPGLTTLYAIVGGSSTQGPAQTTVTINNTDPSGIEQYTLTPTNCNYAWLSVTSAIGTTISNSAPTNVNIPAGGSDVLTFQVSTNHAAVTPVTTCAYTIKWNTATLTTGAWTFTRLDIEAITAGAASRAVTYNKATQVAGVPTATTVITVPTAYASTTFNQDLGTLPPWLTSSLTTATAVSPGAPLTVTFTVANSIAQGMPTGNYTANIGFYTTVPASLGLELSVPFTIQISNGASGVTLIPSSDQTKTFTYGGSTPQPTSTLYATEEPIPFTVTCSVAQTPAVYVPDPAYAGGCSLTGTTAPSASVNGTAFTWGSVATATLDPKLFQLPATIGYQIVVTFTYTNTPLNPQPGPLNYTYTIVPGQAVFAPTGAVLGQPLQPTTMSARTTDYSGTFFNVLVRGNNFYGPKDLQGNAVEGTQVFLGTTQLDNSQPTGGSYVVMDHNDILVTIPVSLVPVVAAGATGTIKIGLANQIDPISPPTAAAVTTNLIFSYIPVVYAVSSTASYLQPTLDTLSAHRGYIPNLAPYELISIFGGNFGFVGTNLPGGVVSAANTLDTYGKFLSPLTLGTPAAAGSKAVSMTVTFKDVTQTKNNTWNAPIVFANQNQINAIVPSGLTSLTTPAPLYNVIVSVTAGGTTTTSDGYFQMNFVGADPGIFTLASDGAGQAAIINQNGSVNGTSPVVNGDTVTIYMAGLGVPDSGGGDVVPTGATTIPSGCVAISQSSPVGLMQVANTKAGTWNPGWTSIDGAVLSYDSHHIVEVAAPVPANEVTWVNYAPCFSASPTITVTIGPPTGNHYTVSGVDGSTNIPYAGFVGGSVAGLYQMNVKLAAITTPASWSTASYPGSGTQPIQVSISWPGSPNPTVYTTPAGPFITLP